MKEPPGGSLSTAQIAWRWAPLFITHITQALLTTLPFSVAVFMVRDFEAASSNGAAVSEQTVGKRTGLLAAVFCAAQLLTQLPWGLVSDRIGRKPVLVIGNISCVASVLLFGLAGTYWQAMAARAGGGALNAIILVEKAMIGEGLESKDSQAKAFGLLALCWGLGSLAGPLVGGALSAPCTTGLRVEALCGGGSLLVRRPYFLPCLLAALLSALATVLSIVGLEETLPSRRRASASCGAGWSGGGGGGKVVYAAVATSEPRDHQRIPAAAASRVAAASTAAAATRVVAASTAAAASIAAAASTVVAASTAAAARQREVELGGLQRHGGGGGGGDGGHGALGTLRSKTGGHMAALTGGKGSVHSDDSAGAALSGDGGDGSLGDARIPVGRLLPLPPLEGERGAGHGDEQGVAAAGRSRSSSRSSRSSSSHDLNVSVLAGPEDLDLEAGRGAEAEQHSLLPDPASQDPAAAASEAGTAAAVPPSAGGAPWYRQQTVVRLLLGYGLIAFMFNMLDEVTPLFASAAVSDGGLGFAPSQLAPSLSFGGVVLCCWALKGFPWLIRRMGVLRTLRLGLWQSAPVALLVPCASLFAGLLLPSQAVMFLAMGLKAITATNAFTGSLILVNAAAPKESLGAVNGAGQSLASLVRALGPALGGLSWGWSSLLVGQDWWPHWVPHQYLPFVAAALVALVTDGVMDRAWSTRTHEHVREACDAGTQMIEKLANMSAQVYSVAHAFPTYAGHVPLTEYGTHEGVPNKLYFALIFFRSVKAGFLLGVEQGQGFVIARLGGATSNQWSAPCFVRITGVEFGLVAGMDRAETLVGVMSDRALEGLIASEGKFNMSSNWNFEITPLEEDKTGGANPSWIFNADFTSASVGRGIMADVAVQGTRIYFDAMWNEKCYGTSKVEDILRGSVEPPPELKVMTDKLMARCSPALAGIDRPLRPSMFVPGTKEAVAGGEATTTSTDTAVPPSTTVPQSTEGVAAPISPPPAR
ncbi:Protein ZINC INDUCED FACILITATOR-LIKE 1 [Chlorella vulgaris]